MACYHTYAARLNVLARSSEKRRIRAFHAEGVAQPRKRGFEAMPKKNRRFQSPANGGFSFEVAAKAVYGTQYLRDVGSTAIGERVCVILEWKGVDQLEVRGKVVHIETEDCVGVLLRWQQPAKKERICVGMLVRGRPELAVSSSSRQLGVWRLTAMVDATRIDADSEPGLKTSREAILSSS